MKEKMKDEGLVFELKVVVVGIWWRQNVFRVKKRIKEPDIQDKDIHISLYKDILVYKGI